MIYVTKFFIGIKILLLLVIIPTLFIYFALTNDRMVLTILFDRMNSDFKMLIPQKNEETV